MDTDRTGKQDYLRKEVILKGYKHDVFEAFIRDKKPDGLDVDNWTFDEIKAVVKLFKETHQPTEEVTELMATTDTFEMYSDLNARDLVLEEENKDNEIKFPPVQFGQKHLGDLTLPEADKSMDGEGNPTDGYSKRTFTGAGLDDKDDDGMLADLLNRIEDYKSDAIQVPETGHGSKPEIKEDASVVEEAASDKARLESKLAVCSD